MKNSFFYSSLFIFSALIFAAPITYAGDSLEMEDGHYSLLSDEEEQKPTKKVSFNNKTTVHEISAGHSHKKRNNLCTKLAKFCRSGQICTWDRTDWRIFGCGLTTVIGVPVGIYFVKQHLS